MKDTTKRICALCGIDQTPLHKGIYRENDRRGDALGLFGECCWGAVRQAVDESPRRYAPASRQEMYDSIIARAKAIKGL